MTTIQRLSFLITSWRLKKMNNEIKEYLDKRIEEVANGKVKEKKTFEDLSPTDQLLAIIMGVPLIMGLFVARGFFIGLGLIMAYKYFF